MGSPSYDFSIVFRRLVQPFLTIAYAAIIIAVVVFVSVFLYYIIRYRINPFKLSRDRLSRLPIRWKPADFIRWLLVDMIDKAKHAYDFFEYGLTIFCGRQGAGKTISMVYYLERIRHMYPDCIIVTNFQYAHSDYTMESWEDFFKYRNDTKGVVFAIDEIHSEYSSASWKDFPETLLSEISQQRKQRIKIVASSQVFNRVAKPIREQTFSVVICRTLANRWTFNREYDAWDLEAYSQNPSDMKKLKSLRRSSFIQSDRLRECYDTYEKIKRLEKTKFIPRHERGA